jgi:dephospho-CoA kinase
MLRVGLTGGIGSGKSTVGAMLAARGAHILSADEIGRQLMQPGDPVFDAIVSQFGPEVVASDGALDRAVLARIAFGEGRVEELNAIVHPAAIARQAELVAAIFALDPLAVVVVESALIFETRYSGAGWERRFDKIVLVTAPEPTKIARFVQRSGGGDPVALAAEARRRLAAQIPDDEKAGRCDYILVNDAGPADLERQVDALWLKLVQASGALA